eukprot:366009-Chlamydomonas_euryale.AAC.3
MCRRRRHDPGRRLAHTPCWVIELPCCMLRAAHARHRGACMRAAGRALCGETRWAGGSERGEPSRLAKVVQQRKRRGKGRSVLEAG